jgi:hypothetical protein
VSSAPWDAQQAAGEPRDLFRRALEQRFAGAAARAKVRDLVLAVGRWRWRLRLAGAALDGPVARALDHLRVLGAPAGVRDDLTVLLWDQASTGIGLPDRPWEDPLLSGRGEIVHAWGPDVRVVYAADSRALQYLDLPARFAAFWVGDPAALRPWERAAPLRALLAGWARAVGGFLVHGAAVGLTSDGDGVLVTGPSGSGKSTTALACLARGMSFAGDDFVMLAPSSLRMEPELIGLYGSAKVAPAELDALDLGPLAREPPISDGAKTILWVNESHARQLARRLRLRAVVVPAPVAGARPRLRPASPVDVARALLPSSAFLTSGADRRSYAELLQVVRPLPAFVLELGRERAANAELLERWLRAG